MASYPTEQLKCEANMCPNRGMMRIGWKPHLLTFKVANQKKMHGRFFQRNIYIEMPVINAAIQKHSKPTNEQNTGILNQYFFDSTR